MYPFWWSIKTTRWVVMAPYLLHMCGFSLVPSFATPQLNIPNVGLGPESLQITGWYSRAAIWGIISSLALHQSTWGVAVYILHLKVRYLYLATPPNVRILLQQPVLIYDRGTTGIMSQTHSQWLCGRLQNFSIMSSIVKITAESFFMM